MAANTTVLIVVAAMAALVLAGMIAGVLYKTRTRPSPIKSETDRDQAGEDALRVGRQEALADEYAARAHAAEVEIDIKTIRACRLQEQATVYRSEATTSRDQLNELREQGDKLNAAAQTPETVRLAGLTKL